MLNNTELKRLMQKPHAFYMPHIPNGAQFGKPDHYYVGIAVEGEPGYFVTNWDYGTDRKLAAKCVDELNAKRGISKDQADRIVMSSMFAKKEA